MTREPLYTQLEQIFQKEDITHVLHVPFARLGVGTKAFRWEDGWFEKRFPDIQFSNALYREDLKSIDISTTFVLITGGSDKMHLYLSIVWNPLLEKAIREAPYLFGSSAGMMVLGKHFRSHKDYKVTHPWLGLFNFVGEGHYTEQNKASHLQHHLRTFPSLDFALGIDEDTVVEIDESWEVIRSRWVWWYEYLQWSWSTFEMPTWREVIDSALQKTIVCDSYVHALRIVHSLTDLIELEQHHPDILIQEYKKLTLRIMTHDAGNTLTQKDISLAKSISEFLSSS